MGRHDEGFFSARDNLRLFWESEVPDAPKAHVGLVHGYGEHSGRYRATIEALAREGYAVHAFDCRGHGQSDGRRGHCDRFSEFVDDVELFWARVVKVAEGRRTFLFAHSHGALVSLHFLQRRPQLAGLILSSPWLRLSFDPPGLKVLAGRVLEKVVPWAPIASGLTSAQLTRDPELQRATDRDPLYFKTATPRWYNQATAAQLEAHRFGPSITVPVYMFCGAEDGIASTPFSRSFFQTLAASDKQYREYPGMLHETLNEIGREEVWKDISRWISEHL